jgi:hypothetical protein
MAVQSTSRFVRVSLGALVATMILSMAGMPTPGGVVDAKGQRHGHGQQHAASQDRDTRVQSAARKQGKGTKRKKGRNSRVQETSSSNAQVSADPGTGTKSGTQGFAGGLATSLPRETWIATMRGECVHVAGESPQSCFPFHFPPIGPLPAPIAAQIEVISSSENCSPVKYTISWKDSANAWHDWTSGIVWPGESTGIYDLGSGVTTFNVNPVGVRGGCNIGVLGWLSTTIKVLTPSDLSMIMTKE